MTAALMERLEIDADSDVEFTWRVWGSLEPFGIVKTEKVSLMRCPMCGQTLVAHMVLDLADAWFHSLADNDFHWRFNDAGLDSIMGKR